MNKTHFSLFVDEDLCGHASQLEQIDFLPVELEHLACRIGQADEGQFIFRPIEPEISRLLRPNDDNLGIALNKLLIVLAQLRQMRLAKWSKEATI